VKHTTTSCVGTFHLALGAFHAPYIRVGNCDFAGLDRGKLSPGSSVRAGDGRCNQTGIFFKHFSYLPRLEAPAVTSVRSSERASVQKLILPARAILRTSTYRFSGPPEAARAFPEGRPSQTIP
jgi:hypothetical protein